MTGSCPDRRPSDEGMTLIDLMVSMAVLSVVMSIFTAGVIDMYRTANHAGSAAETQTRLLTAFNRLEREVRYAQHLYPPHTLPNGDLAVEYVISDATNTRQCVRLAIPANGGNLTHRQWLASGAPTAPQTTIANGLTRMVDESTHDLLDPFLVKAAGTGNSNFDRLEVRLSTTAGQSASGTTRTFQLQYTALNTVSDKVMATLPSCAG